MNDMLDWWTVPGSMWGVKNLDFKVEIRKSTTMYLDPEDHYTVADVHAFYGGDWYFAEVRLTPVDRRLNDLVGYRKTLDGVEWGEIPSAPAGRIDRNDITDMQGLDLARDAVRSMRFMGLAVETLPGSPMPSEKMSAPF